MCNCFWSLPSGPPGRQAPWQLQWSRSKGGGVVGTSVILAEFTSTLWVLQGFPKVLSFQFGWTWTQQTETSCLPMAITPHAVMGMCQWGLALQPQSHIPYTRHCGRQWRCEEMSRKCSLPLMSWPPCWKVEE